ncbi:FabG Dehydrogenases with different specificities (related to short-chain alcohol dehydrogenases) [Methylophilaceae bacterium]
MAFEKFNLNNKTALITGAAGLLGMEHAAALLEIGAKVVLVDINKSALKEAGYSLMNSFDKTRIIIKVIDITKPEKLFKLADELWAEDTRVDILINNAAIDSKMNSKYSNREVSRLENFSLNQWDLEISVGLTGAFLCSQIFGSTMAKDQKGGVILNIASDLSVLSPDQRLYRKKNLADDIQPVKPITYSVIKTGLVGMTRYLATYWADKNVRCNALSPGGVFNGHDIEFVKHLSSLIPMGRMAKPDEYRAAVQFLCSDASGYMNGQNIVMDGGRSVW